MNTDNIIEFETIFMSGNMRCLPEQITIDNEQFTQYGSTGSLFEVYNDPIVIALFKSEKNKLALIWENINHHLVAAGVITTPIEEALDPNLDINNKPQIITDECDAVLIGFNDNNPISARIDTGASQCSLHGEDVKWSKDNDQVQFTFENKRYRMNLVSEQKISSSDGGTAARPVVTFKVKVHGKLFDGISFNINDRGNMPHKMLIGQNLLEHGNFLIDPKGDKAEEDQQNESISDELRMIKEQFHTINKPMITQ